MAMQKMTTMLAHCNLKQNTCLCSKQSSFFPFMQIERRGGPLNPQNFVCNSPYGWLQQLPPSMKDTGSNPSQAIQSKSRKKE